jgi:hypothetical protein
MNSTTAHRSYSCVVKEKDEVWIGIPMGDKEYGERIYKFNYKTRVLYKDDRPSSSYIWRATSTASLTTE